MLLNSLSLSVVFFQLSLELSLLFVIYSSDFLDFTFLVFLMLFAGDVFQNNLLVLLFQLLIFCLKLLFFSLNFLKQKIVILVEWLQLVRFLLTDHLNFLNFQLTFIKVNHLLVGGFLIVFEYLLEWIKLSVRNLDFIL